MSQLLYLASPYSDPDPSVRELRFRQVCLIAGRLMRSGYHVYSPIAHSHQISLETDLPTEWAFWESFARTMLSRCDAFVILPLHGWWESRGVAAELALARELALDVSFAVEVQMGKACFAYRVPTQYVIPLAIP